MPYLAGLLSDHWCFLLPSTVFPYPGEFVHDCKPAVWVYNGFVAVAYEKTKEKPYKNLAWGSGWGETKADAKYQARSSCRGAAQENCVLREVRHTPHTSQLKTRGGPW